MIKNLLNIPVSNMYYRQGVKVEYKGKKFTLSVQGSPYHYCSPRENLKTLLEYNTVEIAFLLEGDFVKAEEVGFNIEDSGDDVYGYVPLETLLKEMERVQADGAIFM